MENGNDWHVEKKKETTTATTCCPYLQMQQTACFVIELHGPAEMPPELRHSPFKTHVPNSLFLPSHGAFWNRPIV